MPPPASPTWLIAWVVFPVVLVLLFGATRLPQTAKGLGQALKIFKKEIRDEDKQPDDKQDNSQNGSKEPSQASGARGGRPVGGGRSRQSPQRQAKPRTGNGNQSTKE